MRIRREIVCSLRGYSKLAQDGVDHAGGEVVAGLLDQFDAFGENGACGDAIHVEQLECAQAESDQDFCIEFHVGMSEQSADLLVELNLPAEHAQDERRDQVAVGGGERIDGFAAQ